MKKDFMELDPDNVPCTRKSKKSNKIKISFYHHYQLRKDVGFKSVEFNFLTLTFAGDFFNIEILNLGVSIGWRKED
jgi:hypothetical protein